MSIKGLTQDELATYYSGRAIRHTMETAPTDPDMRREIEIVYRRLDAALTKDEYYHVVIYTGCDFGGRLFSDPYHGAPDPYHGAPDPDEDAPPLPSIPAFFSTQSRRQAVIVSRLLQ